MCAPFSQTDYLAQFPLYLSSLSFYPLIHSGSRPWCVSQVQSLNSISLPEETLYGGNIPLLILPVKPQRWTTQPQILYLWYGGRTVAAPSSLQAYCLWRFVSGDLSLVPVQRWVSGRVREVLDRHPQGFSYSPALTEPSIIWVQRGKEDFPLRGQLTFVKHWCAQFRIKCSRFFVMQPTPQKW